MDDSIYMDDIQSTQETQSTQPASQPDELPSTNHLWGYLDPLEGYPHRVEFWKSKLLYTFGRNDTNDCSLDGLSGKHCIFKWDATHSDTSATITDISRNGITINGVHSTGEVRILRDGSEIAFPLTKGSEKRIRFIYRHTAYPPQTPIEADYAIGKYLGAGSYGEVKEAKCLSSGEMVAIKTIKKFREIQSPREQIIHPTMREIEILRMLVHENICQLKAVYYQDDPYEVHLVLELVKKGDLGDYLFADKNPFLRSNASPALERSQSITHQICNAVAYVHSKGVTHRDLKPENILVVSIEPPVIKVADFGMAKFVDNRTMLRTKNEGYDNLVDSWSVGVIVFYMLTKEPPFNDDPRLKAIHRVQQRKMAWHHLVYVNIEDALQHTWLTTTYRNNPPTIVKPNYTSADSGHHANTRFPPFDNLPSGSFIPGLNMLQSPQGQRGDTPAVDGDENVGPQPTPGPSVAPSSQSDSITDSKDA
ncbi:hypothetical protein H0H92_009559 [Tricholoma furcatifolium]|nr:hypothetical protein H0H92_009559 [Tricholoma furcatifolium]